MGQLLTQKTSNTKDQPSTSIGLGEKTKKGADILSIILCRGGGELGSLTYRDWVQPNRGEHMEGKNDAEKAGGQMEKDVIPEAKKHKSHTVFGGGWGKMREAESTQKGDQDEIRVPHNIGPEGETTMGIGNEPLSGSRAKGVGGKKKA